MNFDDLSSAWKARETTPLTPADREAMIVRVCRRVERVGGSVLRRDVVETIAALFVIVFFGRIAVKADSVVAQIGGGLAVVWAAFVIWKLHRTRTIQRPAPMDAPVREFCRIEISRLDRQAKQSASVLWWYIAPAMIAANFVYIGHNGFGAESRAYLVFTILLGWVLYALNKMAARQFVEHRDELAGLLQQLNEAGGDDSPAKPDPSTERSAGRRSIARRTFLALAAIAALGYIAAVYFDQAKVYPKLAPFTGVRWENRDQPVVQLGDEWLRLVSIDGTPAHEIVQFSRWTFGKKWRKRFEEDLVELLTRMGHPPGDTVTLVVQPLDAAETRTLLDVPMTEANRAVIYRAATTRSRDGQ